MSAPSFAARHRAREAALQMLYQWEVGRLTPADAARAYWAGRDAPPSRDDEHADFDPQQAVDEYGRRFANALVAGTAARVAEEDALIAAHARNWRIERLAVVDR
ncbi:MAG TPA: transcription antitermination factor NusB, partial [Vicinamibacterales bacterium]